MIIFKILIEERDGQTTLAGESKPEGETEQEKAFAQIFEISLKAVGKLVASKKDPISHIHEIEIKKAVRAALEHGLTE